MAAPFFFAGNRAFSRPGAVSPSGDPMSALCISCIRREGKSDMFQYLYIDEYYRRNVDLSSGSLYNLLNCIPMCFYGALYVYWKQRSNFVKEKDSIGNGKTNL